MAVPKRDGMTMSLAHLTVLDASPVELIEAAAAGGFDAVGLRIVPPMKTDRIVEVIGDEGLIRDIITRCDDTGVRIWDVEAVWLTPETDIAALSGALETGERLGARHLLVVGHDPDFARLADNFGKLCERAHAHRLSVALEMMSYVELDTIGKAVRLLDAARPRDAHLLIDALHFFRSSSTFDQIEALDPSMFAYIHLCDAALAAPPADALRSEGRGGRFYPGEGELRLEDLMSRLPRGIPVAVEAPCARYAHLPPKDRARLCGEATGGFLSRLPFPIGA